MESSAPIEVPSDTRFISVMKIICLLGCDCRSEVTCGLCRYQRGCRSLVANLQLCTPIWREPRIQLEMPDHEEDYEVPEEVESVIGAWPSLGTSRGVGGALAAAGASEVCVPQSPLLSAGVTWHHTACLAVE